MEEQERDLTKPYDLQQPDFRAAENSSLDKGTKPSESGTELELATNIDTHLTEENPASVQNSSTGSLRTQSVVIFDPNGQPLRCEGMVIGQCENGELYVIRSNPLGGTQVLLHNDQLLDAADPTATCIGKPNQEDPLTPAETALDSGTNALCTEAAPGFTDAKVHAKSSPEEYVPSPKPLTAAAPNWANRLRSCEKLGDSYRGYCNTETELEAVLLLHKQQTHSVFGTRQSPSPAKPATRLMWKSQYVPYDGIPFVNAGSRAIVMECQFGPRRKGLQPKKGNLQETCTNIDYKATCPARIYIKKVRKFPEYKVPVDPKVDKKVVRQEQEKAFFNLKKKLWNTGGVIRYYIQLPTQKAHLYHDVDTIILPPLPEQPDLMKEETEEEEQEMIGSEGAEEEEDGEAQGGGPVPSRLHPLVAEKIRVLVAQGCSQVYTVRKQLRRFVEREMFKSNVVPERHNLCYFPTVNDIKNHIHEAQKSLQLTDGVPASPDAEWKTESEHLLTETVTLTLTPASINVSSQKEGLLEGSHTLSPEAVHFFSSLTSLQPKIFAHLQGIQLQCATCPAEGSLAPQPISATEPLDPSNPLYSQAVFLSPASFLQSTPTVGEAVSLPEPRALVGIGQLVSISTMEPGTTEAGVTQILLEDGQAIPVQIVDPSGIALRASAEEVLMRESSETKPMDISPEPPRDQG